MSRVVPMPPASVLLWLLVGAGAMAVGQTDEGPARVAVTVIRDSVRVETRDAPLADILVELANAAGVDLELRSRPTRRLSLEIEADSLELALRRLIGDHGYLLQRRPPGSQRASGLSGPTGRLIVFGARGERAILGEHEHDSAPTPPAAARRGWPDTDGEAASAPEFEQALTSPNAATREAAVSELGARRNAASVHRLGLVLQNEPVPAVREEAVYALGELGGIAAREFLRYALSDPDRYVRNAATAIFAASGAADVHSASCDARHGARPCPDVDIIP